MCNIKKFFPMLGVCLLLYAFPFLARSAPDGHCQPKGDKPNPCAVWDSGQCAWVGEEYTDKCGIEKSCDKSIQETYTYYDRCGNGVCEEPDPKETACCVKTPFDPEIITTSVTTKETTPGFIGNVATIVKWITGTETTYSIDQKKTTQTRLACCGNKVKRLESYHTEGQEGYSVKLDIAGIPLITEAVGVLQAVANKLLAKLPGRGDFEISGSLPGSFESGYILNTRGWQVCDQDEQICSGHITIWSRAVGGGVLNYSVKVKNDDGILVESYPIGYIGASLNIYEEDAKVYNGPCGSPPEEPGGESGCFTVFSGLAFIDGRSELIKLGECN